MNEWNALHARLTLFPSPSSVPVPSALDVYKKVWSGDPTGFLGPTNPLAPSQAQGTIAKLAVNCVVLPSRIDFSFAPIVSQSSPDQGKFQVIEDSKGLRSELDRIVSLIEKGVVANPVVRTAFSMQVVSQQVGARGANQALMAIIPTRYKIDLADEREFMLQLNLPRASAVSEKIRLNRICKWSVEQYQLLSVAGPGVAVALPTLQEGTAPWVTEFILASLAFDNNNDPVPIEAPLSNVQQATLLREAIADTAISLQSGGLNIIGFEQ